MRLLIVGTMNGQIGAASQIAMSRGATVSHSQTIEEALVAMRSGQGADLRPGVSREGSPDHKVCLLLWGWPVA